jgi:hypothetical protein
MSGKKEHVRATTEAHEDLTAQAGTASAQESQEGAASETVAQGAARKEPASHRPAVQPKQKNPALPYDKHHGEGGLYAVVDGKRVAVDEDGKPQPPKKH